MSGVSLKVKIFDSSGTQVVPVAKSNLTVGRAKHCDVVLDHPTVQNEHLRAWFDAGRIWIQDLGSQSGTFLNGIRLPSLKPMLVRELDVLKLGDNPAALGLEANLVRSPVVKPALPVEEVTAPGVKLPPAKDVELEKKRDELARVRRELAELKLQLQMGRLDKESEDEAHRHLSTMRNEAQNLQDQKVRLERTMKQMEQQRKTQLEALEKELEERKNTSLAQLKNLMDHEMSKLAEWKTNVIGEIRRDVHTLSQAKAKAWVTRPLSQDMILEWEADIQNLMRRVLLGESAAAELDDDLPPAPTPGPSRRGREGRSEAVRVASGSMPGRSHATHSEITRTNIISHTGLTHTPVPKVRRKVTLPTQNPQTAKIILMILLIGGLVAAAVLFKKGFFPVRERSVAGETSGSSVTRPQTPVQPKKKYEPIQTKGFRKSYTDNILFTPEFLDLESNPNYRTQWQAEFTKTATSSWKVDPNTAKILMERESTLLADLRRLRESIDGAAEQPGIQAMREREAAFQMELNTLLKTRSMTDKFLKLKKTFFSRQIAKK